jgi:hypothetical protein
MIASIERRRVRHRLRAIVALPQMARSYVTRLGFEPVDRRRLLRLLVIAHFRRRMEKICPIIFPRRPRF